MQPPSSCVVREVSRKGSVRERPASVYDSLEYEAKRKVALPGPEATSDCDTSRAVDVSLKKAGPASVNPQMCLLGFRSACICSP